MKYVCTNCESEFLGWSGKCPSCGEWGTLEEVNVEDTGKKKAVSKDTNPAEYFEINSKHLSECDKGRFSTSFPELDRVLGGGVIQGETILFSGEPGVGKSTLLAQVAINLSQKSKILYVSGEESFVQVRDRAMRLSKNTLSGNFNITNDIHVEKIVSLIEESKFDLVIIDSIQSLVSSDSRGYPGSISQVRICGSILNHAAKETGIPLFIVGQINKEGSIAGPKVLEHLVDCVLYMEGDDFGIFRIVRAVKNRFGSTNEIGVFEMSATGLNEVIDPSSVFMDSRLDVPGCATGAVLKGSRVVFVEVQALTSDRTMEGGIVRRIANGIKKPRLDMLTAVLSRRGGLYLGDKDVFVNIVGGLSIDDPALDLAVCAAIKSAVSDTVLDRKNVYIGEVGLTGEIRGVLGSDAIISEAKRLGYKAVYTNSVTKSKTASVCKVVAVKDI